MLKEQCDSSLYDVFRKRHNVKTTAEIFTETLQGCLESCFRKFAFPDLADKNGVEFYPGEIGKPYPDSVIGGPSLYRLAALLLMIKLGQNACIQEIDGLPLSHVHPAPQQWLQPGYHE